MSAATHTGGVRADGTVLAGRALLVATCGVALCVPLLLVPPPRPSSTDVVAAWWTRTPVPGRLATLVALVGALVGLRLLVAVAAVAVGSWGRSTGGPIRGGRATLVVPPSLRSWLGGGALVVLAPAAAMATTDIVATDLTTHPTTDIVATDLTTHPTTDIVATDLTTHPTTDIVATDLTTHPTTEPAVRPAGPTAGDGTGIGAPGVAGRAGSVYVVVPGDDLWRIAERIVTPDGDTATAAVAAYWRRLLAANAEAIGPDPDLILPGLRLVLPPVDPHEDRSPTRRQGR